MTPEERLYTALCTQSKALGRRLTKDEYLAVFRDQIALIRKESTKERKLAKVDERAQAIFNLYPNRQGGVAALKAISESIAEDGFEMVVDRTTQYANSVARWPRFYRYSQHPDSKGKDMVPHASTWFNQRRYRDDPETWKRVGNAPPPPVKTNLPEPEGWRMTFPDYIHADKAWVAIDLASQRFICDAMQQRAHA